MNRQSSDSSSFFRSSHMQSPPNKNTDITDVQMNDTGFFMKTVDFGRRDLLNKSDDEFTALNIFKS